MDITQTFYDEMASRYDKLYADWQSAVEEEAGMLDGLFRGLGFDRTARVLDCACGIGTQAIGLAGLGYDVTASDISDGELAEARARAAQAGVPLRTVHADFRRLGEVFPAPFDIVIAMDNALPHMLTRDDLEAAARSIVGQVAPGGVFVASIRDYDELLEKKPPYSPPYIHRTEAGQRVAFQTWFWEGDNYRLIQYLIEDEGTLEVSRSECEYRAVRRQELTELLLAGGAVEVTWRSPEETGFYQPIVIARRAGTGQPAQED